MDSGLATSWRPGMTERYRCDLSRDRAGEVFIPLQTPVWVMNLVLR